MTRTDFFDLIERNEIGKVEKLINEGFDIHTKNKYGSSALHIAISKRSMEMVKILVNGGMDVNAVNKEGKNGLHYVAEFNLLDIGQFLLDNNADLAAQDIYGNQPLWTAVFNDKGRNERVEIIKLFLAHGADQSHKNNVGKSPKDIITIAGYKNLESLFS